MLRSRLELLQAEEDSERPSIDLQLYDGSEDDKFMQKLDLGVRNSPRKFEGMGYRHEILVLGEDSLPIEILSFHFLTVKTYTEQGQKYSSLVISFLADNSIGVQTVRGTLLAKLQANEPLRSLTVPITAEDSYFAALSVTGQLYFYTYQVIDSKTRYLKYLKDVRKRTNFGNETKAEIEHNQEQDVIEARSFEGL